MTSPRRRMRWFCAVVVGAATVLAACGINMDTSPRVIDARLSTTTTVADQESGGVDSVLYYVAEGALIPVETKLPDRSPSTLIGALLAPPPTSITELGAYSSIPSGTTLIDSSVSDTELRVNLSTAFDNVVGVSRQQAIAQIVLTVTQEASIRSVEFQIDGDTIQVTSPQRGDRSRVTNCDFRDLLATPDQASSLGMNDASLKLLTSRTARLNMIC